MDSAPRAPISLALAGGALSGALYNMGAVWALEGALPNWSAVRSERIVGTSAGAVVGSVLAFGIGTKDMAKSLEPGGDKHPLRFNRRDFFRIPWREPGPLLSGAFTNAGLERFVERAARLAGCVDRFDCLKAPLFIPAYVNLAVLLENDARAEEALEVLETALRHCTQEDEVLKGQIEVAIAAMKQSRP